MPNKTPDLDRSNLMVDGIADWLMESALNEQTSMKAVFQDTCIRLLAEGIPIIRAHLAFRTLHPLFAAISNAWYRDRETEHLEIAHGSISANADWRTSPHAFMVDNEIDHLRRRLTGDGSLLDFPVLKKFRKNLKATDYLAFYIPFDPEATGVTLKSGVIGSWLTDRPGGFTDNEVRALLRIQSRLAVTFKVLIKSQIADNILNTYLGPDAGRQVLSGQIQRGDYESIHSVIWYSDMRNSTPLADTLSSPLTKSSLDEVGMV